MKKLLAILIILNCGIAHAQLPQYDWTRCAAAKEYQFTHPGVTGGYVTEKIKKPIKMCLNPDFIAYWVDDKRTLLPVSRQYRHMADFAPKFLEDEFAIDGTVDDMLYNVSIVYSSPAEVSIRWTRGGGSTIKFYTTDIPSIFKQDKPTSYSKPVYDNSIVYPIDNDSLNPDLKQSVPLKVKNVNGRGFHYTYPVGKGDKRQEAICPVSIKMYLKKKIPWLNKSLGQVTMAFDVRPDGTIKWKTGGYSLYLPKAKAGKMHAEIGAAMEHMPTWKIQDTLQAPIWASMEVTFD